jgi:hypothetical protein
MAIPVWIDMMGWGIHLIRVFSLDAETDDWFQLRKDLQDPSLTFGTSSLSANGTVLATATMPSGVIPEDYVTGEVRIWDFTVNRSSCHSKEEWIQRGSPVEGSRGSSFGDEVALSSDGGRLAISAPSALNNQGLETGKLHVFAVPRNNETSGAIQTLAPKECAMPSGSLQLRGSMSPSPSPMPSTNTHVPSTNSLAPSMPLFFQFGSMEDVVFSMLGTNSPVPTP